MYHDPPLLQHICIKTRPSSRCQLEKFKFVLDFKIKELKRQIEPRETEIGSMKEQIKEMDRELEQVKHYNKIQYFFVILAACAVWTTINDTTIVKIKSVPNNDLSVSWSP